MASIEASLARITRWLEAHAPAGVRFRPPAASPAPGPLEALYAAADGQEGVHGMHAVFDMQAFLPLEDALREKTAMDGLARMEAWDASWWSPRWHPFASDGMGQLLVVDGETGAVMEFLHDDEERPMRAASIEAFLDDFAGSLERGERVWNDRIGMVEVRALAEMEAHERRRAEEQAAVRRAGRKALWIGIALSVALAATIIVLDRWLRG
jgi:cell wall assembly regulator SMI1